MKVSDIARTLSDLTPGLGSAVVVPSDSIDLPEIARRILVFSAGTITFTGWDNADDTYTYSSSMSFPQTIPVLVRRVKVTGTTIVAGDIHAIW